MKIHYTEEELAQYPTWEFLAEHNEFTSILELPKTVWAVYSKGSGVTGGGAHYPNLVAIFVTKELAEDYKIPFVSGRKKIIKEIDIFELALHNEMNKGKDSKLYNLPELKEMRKVYKGE